MFDYVNNQSCSLMRPKNEFNRTKRFEHTPTGTTYSDDFKPIADTFETYSADALMHAGVALSEGPSFHDVSLNSLDNVEEQSLKILDSEDFIIHDKNNEEK